MAPDQAVHVLSQAYQGLHYPYPGCRPLWQVDADVGRLYAECVGAWESAYVAGVFQQISSDFEGEFMLRWLKKV